MKNERSRGEQLAEEVKVLQLQIGELKEAEIRRRKAEAEIRWLAAIIESTDVAIFSKTLDGIILSWNKGAEKMYGYSAEEIIGEHVAVLAPDHSEEIEDILARVRDGEKVSYETSRVRKDNGWIHVSLTVSPVRDAAGGIIGASTIGRDITELKRAEEELRQAGAYNRSLIEASLDPLVTIGSDGRIMDVNAGTELVTGCSREELIGKDFSDYFTEPERARAGYQQVFREGTVRDYALELRHRDGHVTPVLYNASVYRDEGGNVIGVFAAARDITELKRAEEVREKLISELREALAKVKTLSGLLPICASCKKVRDDRGYWTQIESYIRGHSEVEFSHGLCPDCARKLYPEYADRILEEEERQKK